MNPQNPILSPILTIPPFLLCHFLPLYWIFPIDFYCYFSHFKFKTTTRQQLLIPFSLSATPSCCCSLLCHGIWKWKPWHCAVCSPNNCKHVCWNCLYLLLQFFSADFILSWSELQLGFCTPTIHWNCPYPMVSISFL